MFKFTTDLIATIAQKDSNDIQKNIYRKISKGKVFNLLLVDLCGKTCQARL